MWELGTGGMASVYLGRARGPAGFHRWFAIKRIHRHLAKDERFVHMFLDEARIAALVQHPNVAQVFDLGEDDEEHYIAMEYLHGEHLGLVAHRAVQQWGHVPFELAARVIASAADGLHHAHEVRGPKGELVSLVHRDVSPQNIFVTYEGTVKLTDFGIAKAENRLSHTVTGGMKGKSAYMAPEQALGQSIDRRTDIFALGIVLWEITTGRRLFKAPTDAQTLMRVTSGKIRRPSDAMPDYPEELERIVMHALSRKPGDRYPSAAVMARDLDRWVASTSRPAGQAELRSIMRELFADRIVAKDELLRSEPGTEAGRSVPTLPRAEDSSEAALPIDQSESEVVFRRPAPKRARKSRTATLAIGGFLAALLVGALGAAIAVLGGSGDAVVRIDTRPSGAVVAIDGVVEEGTTPLLLEGVRAGRHRVRVSLDGFEPVETTFDVADERVNLDYRLVEESEAEPVPEAGPVPVPVPDPESDSAPVPEPEPAPEPEPEPDSEPAPSPMTNPARTTRTAPRTAPAAPAFLNLITRPWATVTINGRSAGTTPLMRHSVPSGTLVIRLRAEGRGATRTLRIDAAPGETVSRSIDL